MAFDPAIRGTLNFLADFGDIAVIFPAFVGAALMLILCGRHLDVLGWGLALAVCIFLTWLLKTEIGGFKLTVFGHGVRATSFPSGHATMSVAFYGGLAGLLWYGSKSIIARLFAAALLVLQTLIVSAVFLLGWHPLLDLLAGLLLGGVSVGMLYPVILQRPRKPAELFGIVVAVAGLVAAMHGARFDDQHPGVSFLPEVHVDRSARGALLRGVGSDAGSLRFQRAEGYPPYHPGMMTPLLLYAYSRGVYSSRQNARASEERLDVQR